MRRRMLSRLVAVVSVALALSITATACGKRSSGEASGDAKTITIGELQGWAEDQATTLLWKQVLQKKGYTVHVKQLSQAGPMFAGLAQGNLDLYLDVWLPKTHKQYVDKFKGKFEDLGIWYDHATLDITVPKYMKNVNSIPDLKKVSGELGGQITGIEAGAGETGITKQMIKGYGLSKYTLKTSSTASMLSALKSHISQKKPIVVTLWRPHWAYSVYPLKDLKDPKGLMGSAEKLHAYAPKGFSKAHKQVAKWLGNFKINDAQLGSLETQITQKHKDNPTAGVKAWMAKHQSFVKQMTS